MKPDPTEHDRSLDELLGQWQVRRQAPEGFRRGVWARIEQDRQPRRGWERCASFLLRPPVFAAVSAVAVATGGVVAWLREEGRQISPHDAYVQSVSPFASVHLAHR
jgi:hypothetical protein